MADSAPPAIQGDARGLLLSASEEARLSGLKLLLAHPPHDVAEVLGRMAQSDPSAALRYTARKALDLWTRRQGSRPAPILEPIEAALESPESSVRAQAAEAISARGLAQLMPKVRVRLGAEPDPGVRSRLVALFDRWAEPGDQKLLAPLLADEDHRVRANAVSAIARADVHSALPLLLPLLADQDHRVRANCALALSQLGDAEVLVCLERMLASDAVSTRDAAAYALSRLEDLSTLPLLRKAMTDASPMVRQKAQKGLARLAEKNDPEARRLLEALAHPEAVPRTPAEVPEAVEARPMEARQLSDDNPKIRIRALTEAIVDGKREWVPRLIERLGVEENDFVLSKLLVALGELGGQAEAEAVKPFLEARDARVASTAIETLTKLKAFGHAGKVRPMLSMKSGRIRAAALLYLEAVGGGFDPHEALEKMLNAREFDLRLAGLYALERLHDQSLTALVEPLLSDLSDEVRERAFALLERRAAAHDPMAADLLEMCRQGFVERKERSLKLEPASPNKRLLALAYDVFAIYFVAICALVAAGSIFGTTSFLRGGAATLALVLCCLVFFLCSITFFIRDGLRDGRGISKGMLGLRVIDLRHNRGCPYPKAILRSAFLGVPVLNFVEGIVTLAAPDGRRIADRLLDTLVIDEKGEPLTVFQRIRCVILYLMIAVSALGGLVSLFEPSTKTDMAARRSFTTPDEDGRSEAPKSNHRGSFDPGYRSRYVNRGGDASDAGPYRWSGRSPYGSSGSSPYGRSGRPRTGSSLEPSGVPVAEQAALLLERTGLDIKKGPWEILSLSNWGSSLGRRSDNPDLSGKIELSYFRLRLSDNRELSDRFYRSWGESAAVAFGKRHSLRGAVLKDRRIDVGVVGALKVCTVHSQYELGGLATAVHMLLWHAGEWSTKAIVIAVKDENLASMDRELRVMLGGAGQSAGSPRESNE